MSLEYEIIIYFVPKLHNENSHITMLLLYKNFGLQSYEIVKIVTQQMKNTNIYIVLPKNTKIRVSILF